VQLRRAGLARSSAFARAPLTAYLLDRFAVAVSPYTMRRRIASGRDGMSV
jgi:hypothetical protein